MTGVSKERISRMRNIFIFGESVLTEPLKMRQET